MLGSIRSSPRDHLTDHLTPQQRLHDISRLDLPISLQYLLPYTSDFDQEREDRAAVALGKGRACALLLPFLRQATPLAHAPGQSSSSSV
jgi:hypothetical protein